MSQKEQKTNAKNEQEDVIYTRQELHWHNIRTFLEMFMDYFSVEDKVFNDMLNKLYSYTIKKVSLATPGDIKDMYIVIEQEPAIIQN